MAEYHKGAYRQGMEIDPVAARPLGGTGGRAYRICAATSSGIPGILRE